MPLYSYLCEKCGEFDRFLRLADYKTPQVCDCGLPARKIIKPTQINCDIQPWDYYESPSSGKMITSYRERREDMARTGCVDYEPSMKDEYHKKQRESELKLEKAFDETVEKEISTMPSKKKEKLENELKYTDLTYERL